MPLPGMCVGAAMGLAGAGGAWAAWFAAAVGAAGTSSSSESEIVITLAAVAGGFCTA